MALAVVVACCLRCPLELQGQTPPRALVSDSSSNRYPAFSPDGTELVFESDRNGSWSLFRLVLGSNEVFPLVTTDADERSPTWSPDGQQVAFVRLRDGGSELAVVEVSTREVTTLAQAREPEGPRTLFPDWSPDGRTIAYTAARAGEFSVELLRLGTGSSASSHRAAVEELSGARWPRWSPDGSRLAYFSRIDTEGRDDEIYSSHFERRSTTRLTRREGHDFCPAWSPDGERLVFVSVEPDGSRYLRIVDESGGELARIASGWHRVTEPSWSADGVIAYAARSSPDEPYGIYVQPAP